MRYKQNKTLKLVSLIVCAALFSGVSFASGSVEGAKSATVDGEVFLGGTYLEIGIHSSGSYGTSGDAPSDFFGTDNNSKLGLSNDADGFGVGTDLRIDYFLPGSPIEGFAIGVNNISYRNYGLSNAVDITPVAVTDTTSGENLSATVEFTIADLHVLKTISFKVADTYLKTEVVMTNRGPEIRLSRTSPMFLVKLFETEVPEILDGTIEIKSAAREPGHRAKIAVVSVDRDIDPVGACVGMKGSRVQNVVEELQGEKIDIVKYNEDIETFARAALAPSEITNIMLDSDDNMMDVIVEEDQLSLAIGRRGQNVRLAAMLTGYRINIISKGKLQEKITKAVDNLLQVEAISDARAQVMVQNDIMCVGDVVALDATSLSEMMEISEEDAATIIKATSDAIEAGTIALQPEGEEEIVSASAVPAYKGMLEKASSSDEDGQDKFSDAEKRLREELAAFKIK